MRRWVVARISTHTVRPDLAEAMATFEPPTPREVTDVDDHL